MPNHENRIIEKRCPYCGQKRPQDWFVSTSQACWKCRELKCAEPADAAKVVRSDDGLIG